MPFAYTLTKADVYNYWRDFEARQLAKRATRTRKERDMPLTKSVSEVAWAAVYALARDMVAEGQAPDVDTAVQQLRLGSHPVYMTYLAAQASGAPTPTTPAADVGKVVKAAQEVTFAKRRQVESELQKRVDRLVRSGEAPNEAEAVREVFKRDRDFFNRHRDLTYAKGPAVPPPSREGLQAVEPGPVYAAVKKMARELRDNDPWGQFVGKSEAEMEGEVFNRHPELHKAYRNEVLR